MPVYNAERYLHRAIDSILAQTMKEWELILVDDGSTDKSGVICDEYGEQDGRIRVYHKPNGGVASARQLGTDVAKGEYSIHCDSDDWAEPTMLEEMLMQIEEEQVDILISYFFYDSETGAVYIEQTYEEVATSKGMIKSILGAYNHGSLWNKMIRHTLYDKYNVRYVEGINYCEDVLVLAQLMKHNVSIAFLNRPYYHYCMENVESITRHYTAGTYLMRQEYIRALKAILSDEEYNGAVDYATLRVKAEAIERGLIRWKDINQVTDWMRTSIMAPHYGSFPRSLWLKYAFWYVVDKFQ